MATNGATTSVVKQPGPPQPSLIKHVSTICSTKTAPIIVRPFLIIFYLAEINLTYDTTNYLRAQYYETILYITQVATLQVYCYIRKDIDFLIIEFGQNGNA